MREQLKREKCPLREAIEDLKYKAFQEAMDEEDRVIKEIDNVLKTMPREEAEKIVFEKYALLMDEAMQRSKRALQEWHDSIDESHKQETLEK